MLLGPEGEKMLDMEIAKGRAEVGEEKFNQYLTEFYQELAEERARNIGKI